MSLNLNNVGFNFTHNINTDLKSQFIADYGEYSARFIHLDPLGKQKLNTLWPYLVLVVGLILAILCYFSSRPDKKTNDETNTTQETNEYSKLNIMQKILYGLQDKERNTMQKMLYGLSLFFILCSVFGVGYGGYLYLFIYMPEYFKWLDKLPNEGKIKLGMITSIDKISTPQTQFR
jgi:hypothetical protein